MFISYQVFQQPDNIVRGDLDVVVAAVGQIVRHVDTLDHDHIVSWGLQQGHIAHVRTGVVDAVHAIGRRAGPRVSHKSRHVNSLHQVVEFGVSKVLVIRRGMKNENEGGEGCIVFWNS